MAKGNEITLYKNKIIRDILYHSDSTLSADIVRALDEAYIGREDELIYRNIFPYLRIPQTQTEAKAYITMSVDMPKLSAKNFLLKDMRITLNVIVHQDLMKMDDFYSSTRADYIASRLSRIFNRSRNYGTAPLEYASDTESVLQNKYFVRTLQFRCNELNSARC